MPRTDEQKEAERLLGALENGIAAGNVSPEMFLNVVKLCRLQQEEIKELQAIPQNIGLGIRVIGYVGSGVSILIGAVGGLLAIKGYFKG